MESFNEDADGLFACLLEEPGGDQSVNYEVDQSQNQGALGGQNQSFGYDDGYGGQADDSVGGGGGGDDGGGMSLGAQFLDLVANTIGDDAGFAPAAPKPTPPKQPSYSNKQSYDNSDQGIGISNPPMRQRPRQQFQQGQIVRPRQGDIVGGPKIQPMNRMAKPLNTKVQKASPNLFIKTQNGTGPKRIIGTPIGAGIKIRRPGGGVPIAGPGGAKPKPSYQSNQSGPSIRPTEKAPSIPSMRNKQSQMNRMNRGPVQTASQNDMDGSFSNAGSNQNFQRGHALPRNQQNSQYCGQNRGPPQNQDDGYGGMSVPVKDNNSSFSQNQQSNAPLHGRQNQFDNTRSGPNQSFNKGPVRNNQGQFQSGQSFNPSQNRQKAPGQVGRHPVGQPRPVSQNIGLKPTGPSGDHGNVRSHTPQGQSFDDWSSPSPEGTHQQQHQPRQRNPTPNNSRPQMGHGHSPGNNRNSQQQGANMRMNPAMQPQQKQQLTAEQSWDRAMGNNSSSGPPNSQKRASLPGQQNQQNSQQPGRYTNSPMNQHSNTNLGPYESEPISPLTSSKSPYQSQSHSQGQNAMQGQNQMQRNAPQNRMRPDPGQMQGQKSQFRGSMDSNFPMSPPGTQPQNSRMHNQNQPSTNQSPSMHQRVPSLGNSSMSQQPQNQSGQNKFPVGHPQHPGMNQQTGNQNRGMPQNQPNNRRQSSENRNQTNDDLGFLDFGSTFNDPNQASKTSVPSSVHQQATQLSSQPQPQSNINQPGYPTNSSGPIPSSLAGSMSAPLSSSATPNIRTSMSNIPGSMAQQSFNSSSIGQPVSTFSSSKQAQPIQQTSSMPSHMPTPMQNEMNRSIPSQQQQQQQQRQAMQNMGQKQPSQAQPGNVNDNNLNDWLSSIMTDNNKQPSSQPSAPAAQPAAPPKPRSSLLNVTPNMSKSQASSHPSQPPAPQMTNSQQMLLNLKQEPIDTSYMRQAAEKTAAGAVSSSVLKKPSVPAPAPVAPKAPGFTGMPGMSLPSSMPMSMSTSIPQSFPGHPASVSSALGAIPNAQTNPSVMHSMLTQPALTVTTASSKPSVITSLNQTEKSPIVLTPTGVSSHSSLSQHSSTVQSGLPGAIKAPAQAQQATKQSSKFGMKNLRKSGLFNYWGQIPGLPAVPSSAVSSIPSTITASPLDPASKAKQGALQSGLQSAMAAAGHPTMTPPNIADLIRMGVPMESITPQMMNALMGVHRDPYGRPLDNYLGSMIQAQAEMTKSAHGMIPGMPGAIPGLAGKIPEQPSAAATEKAAQKPSVSSGGLMNALSQTISKQNTKDSQAKSILEEVKNQKVQELENRRKLQKDTIEPGKASLKTKDGHSNDDTPIVDLLRSTPDPSKKQAAASTTPIKPPSSATPAAPVTPSAFNWKKKMASSASTDPTTPTSKPPLSGKSSTSSVIMSNPNLVSPKEDSAIAKATPLSDIIAAELKEKKKKRKKKKEERRRRKTKDSDDEAKESSVLQKHRLPPDPGYIPKVRITTYRSLNGSTVHLSHQFKPGDEKPVKTRGRRAKKDLESGSVDLSEMYGWERSYEEKRRKRRRAMIGLPEEDEIPEKEQRVEEPVKEDKPMEPIQIEDEKPQPDKENQEFSSLIYSSAPIPRRVLPKPPARLHLDDLMKNTFKCEECNDEFLFEKSLKHHYDRESILIHIHCIVCNLQQVFKNKCQLLRHAREHSLNGKPMKFVRPKIMPLTMSMCQNIKTTAPDKNTKYAKSCSECSKRFATRIGLQEHMSEKIDETECDVCHTVLPNMCAYQAHCRIHNDMGGNTFVCPECGENFKSDELEFRKHIKLHCAHTSKIRGFRCPTSRKVFSRAEHLRAHWQNHCLIKFHKCSVCPIAFRGQKSIRNHQQEKHPKTNMLYKSIFQCPLCDTLFEDRESPNVSKHLMEHTKNHTYTVYHCLVCPEVFEHSSELMEHLLADHNISEYKTPAAELESALEYARTSFLSSKNGQIDNHNKLFTDEEFSDDGESISKGRGRNRRDRSRARSPEPSPGTPRRTYICSICDFSSSQSEKLQRHFKKTHKVNYVTADMIRTKVSQTSISSSSLSLSNRSNGVSATLPPTGGNVLMTPQGPIPMRNMRKEPTQEELAQEDPPLPEVYKCAKCDYQHRSREDFQRHIRIHSNFNTEEKQCTECGQSFASLPALEKHLFMSHKIVSIHQLDRIDKGFREPMAPKNLKSSTTYSCKACHKSFNSEVVLKQHEKQHESGQRLLEFYLKQLPDSFVNFETPKTAENFEEWSAQWFSSEKETKRLREAGVHEFVVHDAIAQVLFNNVQWRRQEKVLFIRDWLLDNHLKFEAKRQIFDNFVSQNQTKRMTTPRETELPFGGLIHFPELAKSHFKIKKTEAFKKNTTNTGALRLLSLDENKKVRTVSGSTLYWMAENYYQNSTKSAFDLFSNLRFIVLVRDPRSLAASRLTHATSRTARKAKFFDFLQSWVSIMTAITKMCDENRQRCFYLRYEDLLERPGAVLKAILSTKARITALRPAKLYDNLVMREFPEERNATKWKDFVPEGTIEKLREHEELLRRFRYPLDHLSDPAAEKAGNPLDNIESEFDLYQLEPEAAVNF
ncbi:Oidioi.mRNA.OKI2018_I69.chr2.g4436.t3.cds [Oikopleura dioica]|uniref:Oidioi.mRNA.OKI2018_I69.chr2.g4436.t3.cds n=1 Tax=Oikopleura dioica TaxID=34765 RepID=A0ABN7T1L0_OIKDI|nr:Oidioi.mRNA.OKI2018_I69.chr2.g4436.t3.cds [Oikopleura dioica]